MAADQIYSVPKHRQLRELLLEKILGGQLRPGARFPTQREIMAEYELSYSTVSRALSDLAREGYISRMIGSGTVVTDEARRLLAGPFAIHCVVPGPVDQPGQFSLFKGLLDGARSIGAEVHIQEDVSATGRSALLDSLDRGREGVVVPYFAGERRFIEDIRSRGLPYVVMDVATEMPGYSVVLCDHRRAAHRLGRTLLDAGHDADRVGVIVGAVSDEDRHQWQSAKASGFFDALERSADHSLVELCESTNDLDAEAVLGAEASARLMEREPGITALAVDGAYRALGAARTAMDLGMRIPEDLSIVCMGRAAAWEPLAGPIAHAWAPRAETGRAAAEAIADVLAGAREMPVVSDVEMVFDEGVTVATARD